MQRIDTSIEWIEAVRKKRCPNGYHRWSDGTCHPKDQKEPVEGRQPKTEQGDAKPTATIGDRVSHPVRFYAKGTRLAKLVSEASESEDARKEIAKYIDEHDGEVPQVEVEPFRMRYQDGAFVRATDSDSEGFTFDGHTSTQSAYQYEDPKTGDKVYTEERRKFHEDIIQSIINGYTDREGNRIKGFTRPPVGQKPKLIVTGGGSGSGKSTILKRIKKKEGWDYPSVDPDAIMINFFPEWDELVKQNPLQSAYLAHDEASFVSKELYKTLIKGGYNLVMDTTFSMMSKVDEIFDVLKEEGVDYDTRLIGMMIDEDKAVKSCNSRFVATKRLVPQDVARKSNKGFEDIAHDDDVTSRFGSVEVYYRDGDDVTPVMKRDKDGGNEILSEAHWNRSKKMKKAKSSRFKFDLSRAEFSDMQSDGCRVKRFDVSGDRYDMTPDIYSVPEGEIGWWNVDGEELRQLIKDRYGPQEPHHEDEEYYGPDGMYSEELEAKFREEAYQWERDADAFDAQVDALPVGIAEVKVRPFTMRCKADGYGTWDMDEDKDISAKVNLRMTAPNGEPVSMWVDVEATFYPSEDVLDFMRAYADEEAEGMDKSKDRTMIDTSERVGKVLDLSDEMASRLYDDVYDGVLYDNNGEFTINDVTVLVKILYHRYSDLASRYQGSAGSELRNIMGQLSSARASLSEAGDILLNIQYALDDDSDWQYIHKSRQKPKDIGGGYSRVHKGRFNDLIDTSDPASVRKEGKHNYQLYQFDIRNNEDSRRAFFDLTATGVEEYESDRERYEPLYIKTYEFEGDEDSLEDVYYRFNMDRPSDFKSYSLSVGDIIIRDGEAFMVDGFGFKPVGFVAKACDGRTEKDEGEEPKGQPAEIPKEEPEKETPAEDIEDETPKEEPQEEQVEKAIRDPYLAFEKCLGVQGSRPGLMYDEVMKAIGDINPDPMLDQFSKRGMIRRIKCSDGWMYRFDGTVRRN